MRRGLYERCMCDWGANWRRMGDSSCTKVPGDALQFS